MFMLHAIERSALDHVDGAPASDVLCRFADALGGTQIMVAAARGQAGPRLLPDTAYIDPDLLALAQKWYVTPETNPLFSAMPRFTPDLLSHFTAYTSWDSVLHTPFYADYWEPSGVWHAGHFFARFTSDWGLVFAFGAQIGRDWYAGEEARLAAEGARTIARAIRLRGEIDHARAVAAANDCSARLMVLVDRAGTILRAPDGAADTLRDLKLCSIRAKRLAPRSEALRRQLDGSIAAALSGNDSQFVVMDQQRLMITVRPGPRYRHRRSALMCIDHPRETDWTVEMLTNAYGLTSREGAVVLRLCAGRSTEEIAIDLGLAVSSVRLYLKRAMSKTNVHSQAQLVAQILR